MIVFGRILSRYIFWQAAGALILILVSLTTVVWIAVALRQLELMTSQGQDALRFPDHDGAGNPQPAGADSADCSADRLSARSEQTGWR